ncbi:neurexin 1-like [Anabrus simplex]|uniref:neurexin 1-like n=1 Tax=Anabrus simplex TaxID=316456 RepID=UPI0035A302ED
MPSWYNTKLTLLALPSVIFEPRFGGAIRNLVYADDEVLLPRRQEMKMKDYKCGAFLCTGAPSRKLPRGIRGNATDACEDHDPCQHGGICISTDSGPICECRNVDFEGIFCEKEHVWDVMGGHIRSYQPPASNLPELTQHVFQALQEIPQDVIRRLFVSIPRRIQECNRARGVTPRTVDDYDGQFRMD